MSPSTVADLVNAIDESLSTVKHLAELGPAIDDGSAQYFGHAVELLALIARESSHLEKLSTQLARCVLPLPHAVEDAR
jgi:hypothetical protein